MNISGGLFVRIQTGRLKRDVYGLGPRPQRDGDIPALVRFRRVRCLCCQEQRSDSNYERTGAHSISFALPRI